MVKKLLGLATLAAAPLWALGEAQAQNAPQNGVLVVFGNDPCPTNTDGEEVVVCERRGESERFRIPKELREPLASPNNESWATRSQATLEAGATGIGSCSTVGPGGGTGCFVQGAERARAERRQREEAAQTIPLP